MRARAICNLPSLHQRYLKKMHSFSASQNCLIIIRYVIILVILCILVLTPTSLIILFKAYLHIFFLKDEIKHLFLSLICREVYLLYYDVLFFICHMIITLDTLCFLLLFVLHSSQCSCSFLGQQLKVMTLFYEANIWSKHRQYLQQCKKKNFDADKSLYALKKKL